MKSPCVATLLLALACTAAQADAGAPGAPGSTAEPAVQRNVVEDDVVRIEELKVRGQTTRVVVRSKVLDVRPYEVLLGDAGRDPSQRGRAAGQRVWQLFAF